MNVLKGKELTNVRAAGRDDNILLTLEKALAYIEDDELVEVTPGSICCASAISTRTSARRPSGWPRVEAASAQ